MASQSDPDDQIILVNPFTQRIVVIEGYSSINSLFRASNVRTGRPPATKASIDALPAVESAGDEEGECVICLEEWGGGGGGGVKEMGCKHRFHGGCLERWLGVHGSCPLCRFEMPCEASKRRSTGGERSSVWVGFALGSWSFR